MAVISLEGMQFYAYHGFYEEERVIGGEYLVDIHISTDTTAAAMEDELAYTINYETVYAIVQAEMRKPSKLLEQIIARIVLSLKHQFSTIMNVEVRVKKLNPPLDGQVASSSVEEEHSFISGCGRCGRPFVCYQDDTCWCQSVNDVYSKTAQNLREQFGGKCLCKNCLSFYAG